MIISLFTCSFFWQCCQFSVLNYFFKTVMHISKVHTLTRSTELYRCWWSPGEKAIEHFKKCCATEQLNSKQQSSDCVWPTALRKLDAGSQKRLSVAWWHHCRCSWSFKVNAQNQALAFAKSVSDGLLCERDADFITFLIRSFFLLLF